MGCGASHALGPGSPLGNGWTTERAPADSHLGVEQLRRELGALKTAQTNGSGTFTSQRLGPLGCGGRSATAAEASVAAGGADRTGTPADWKWPLELAELSAAPGSFEACTLWVGMVPNALASEVRDCLSLVFPLPRLPLHCASTAKTLPLPCAHTAKTLPLSCASAALRS